MLILNQINSFANCAFNLSICIVSFYLLIYSFIFDSFPKYKSGGFFSHYENMPIQIYRKFYLQKLKIFW